jgi:hypothetical protein
MQTKKERKMQRVAIDVKLSGMSPFLFNRFWGHSAEDIPPEKKLYLAEDNAVILPVQSLKSFLGKEKPMGVIKIVEKRGYQDYNRIAQSHVDFGTNPYVPFTDDAGNIIRFAGFDNGKWGILMEGGCTISSTGAVIKQEPKPRPYLKLPWNLEFEVGVWESDINTKITPEKLRSWFEIGGMLVALGNHRPDYGRFRVSKWDVKV